MKKFRFVFSIHTLWICCISMVSSFISLQYKIALYIDFVIVGIILSFPISFAMREAFRRRERAIQYLSLFKSTLQSIFYCFESSKLDRIKKDEVKHILMHTSEEMIDYLSGNSEQHSSLESDPGRLLLFIQNNEENIKSSFSVKILLFYFRVNESIEFLLATRRHQTPWGLRFIILFAIYMFAIFYPASLLNRTGFLVPLWFVFVMTFFKGLLFICLYNIQRFLEDPFNQKGPDSIRLEDFRFSGLTPGVIVSKKVETIAIEQHVNTSSAVVSPEESGQ